VNTFLDDAMSDILPGTAVGLVLAFRARGLCNLAFAARAFVTHARSAKTD